MQKKSDYIDPQYLAAISALKRDAGRAASVASADYMNSPEARRTKTVFPLVSGALSAVLGAGLAQYAMGAGSQQSKNIPTGLNLLITAISGGLAGSMGYAFGKQLAWNDVDRRARKASQHMYKKIMHMQGLDDLAYNRDSQELS